MSLAATRRRGLLLNWRFAVNGIQKASRLLGTPGNGVSSVSYMTGSNGTARARRRDISTRATRSGRQPLVRCNNAGGSARPPREDRGGRVVPHRADHGAGDTGEPPRLIGVED